MIVDTQIISYCYSGRWDSKKAQSSEISAITAAEFLTFHTREDGTVDYYVIDPERYGSKHSLSMTQLNPEIVGNAKWAKTGAKKTDSVIIDFSNEFQPYRIYGNKSITSILNNKNIEAFKLSISHLEKNKQKNLKKKIEFLFDNDVKCHSLNKRMCDITLDLFIKFLENTTAKNNIKNTVNDLLILSTAIEMKTSISTEDKVLGEFAAKVHLAKIKTNSNILIIDFSENISDKLKKNRESKGYINRGWSYSFIKGYL